MTPRRPETIVTELPWRQTLASDDLIRWQQLADDAAEPNPLFESWALLPALHHYAAGADVRLLAMTRQTGNTSRWIGLAPIEILRSPLRRARVWRHQHCYLASPLMARGRQPACWAAMLDWIAGPGRSYMFNLNTLRADGSLFASLAETLRQRHQSMHLRAIYARPAVETTGTWDSYLTDHLGPKYRGNHHRLMRRLREKGRLEMDLARDAAALDNAMEEFLTLEMNSWKGRSGTAMRCDHRDEAYFRQISRAAFEKQRLAMVTLRLDGRPLAVLHIVFAGDGAFSLKTAFDEHQADYSPGSLLQIESLRLLFDHPGCRWVDSCTAPGSPLRALWKADRLIANVICSTGRRGSDLLVASLPLLNSLRRRVKRQSQSPASAFAAEATAQSSPPPKRKE